MGLVLPAPGYLEGLRAITHEARRAAHLRRGDHRLPRRATAARRRCYGITPDLTCLGKIVGGGLPAAAFGGRADIMQKLAPLGPVYQAGTLSAAIRSRWPPASRRSRSSAGPGTYERLEQLGKRLGDGLAAAAQRRRRPARA